MVNVLNKGKRLPLTAIFLVATIALLAQNQDNNHEDRRPLNSMGINLFGYATLVSVNYDRLFLIGSTNLLSSQIGLGYNEEYQFCIFGPCASRPHKYITIPHHFTINLGERKHFLEIGLGGSVIMGNTTQPYVIYPIFGYRYLPLNSGKINFRAFGHIPIYGLESEDVIFVPIGLNLGYSF